MVQIALLLQNEGEGCAVRPTEVVSHFYVGFGVFVVVVFFVAVRMFVWVTCVNINAAGKKIFKLQRQTKPAPLCLMRKPNNSPDRSCIYKQAFYNLTLEEER